jgi:hypothetical protein
MSNVVKKNEAADAAMSAIEEALNLAAKEAPESFAVTEVEAPKRKIKIEKPVAAEEEIFSNTPVVNSNLPELDRPVYVPAVRAANDEKSELGVLLYGLGKKPSQFPLVIAAIVSIFWAIIAGFVAVNSNMTATSVGVLSATILVLGPVLIIFAFAYMMIRAQEMRLVAKGMTEVAMRLAEPESVARDAVTSVGQAVRREVEAMNAGVNQTLRHATELESRVSNEVKMIEAAFQNNEARIRDLVNELSAHRQSIMSHSGDAQSALSTAHHSLISELTSSSQGLKSVLETTQNELIARLTHHNSSLTNNLSETTNKVLGEFKDKSQALGDNLLLAGNSVMDTINLRSTDILDRLTSTGDEVVTKLVAANNDVTKNIHENSDAIITTISKEVGEIRTGLDRAASALTTSLVEHSDKMTNSLHSIGTEVAMSLAQTGADVTESISQRASEVNQTFKHTGDNLILDLGLRGSEITQKLDETGSRIGEYITDRGNALADRISDTGNKLYETVNVYGVDLDKRLSETGGRIAEALATRTAEAQRNIAEVGLHVVDTLNEKAMNVQTALHQAGHEVSETMNQRGAAFKSDLETVGYGLIGQFEAKSNELTDKFSLLGGDFTHKFNQDATVVHETFKQNMSDIERVITVNGVTLTKQLGETISQMSGIMSGHVSGFDMLANRLSVDVAMKLTDASTGMAQNIRSELMNFDKTVTDKTLEVSGTLDERINRLDKSLAQGASALSQSLAERAVEIANSLSNGGASVTAIMEQKSIEMSGALARRVEGINSALGQKALEVAQTLETSVSKIGSVSAEITNKTNDLASLFDEKGSFFIETLSQKTDHISGEITKISVITNAISAKTVELTKAMNDSANVLNERGAVITNAISAKTIELGNAMKESTNALSNHLSPLLNNLGKSNEQLKVISQDAQANLQAMENQLSKTVVDLQKAVTDVNYASETGVTGLDKQVIALNQLSGGTLTTLSDLTGRIERQTSDLHTLNDFFDKAQVNFSSIVDERRAKLEQLVSHMGERTINMEETLTRFNHSVSDSLGNINGQMKKQLEDAQIQAQTLISLIGVTGQEQNNALTSHLEAFKSHANEMTAFVASLEQEQAKHIAEHVVALKNTYTKERDVSQQMIQKAYDSTLTNIDALYIDSASKFNELTQNLRVVSSEIGRELESTRAELKRGLIDMPRETQEQASSMRRVVADQIKALAELNDIVSKSGRSFDVAQTVAPQATRYAMPLKTEQQVVSERLPEPEYIAPQPLRKPVEEVKPKKKEGWLSDILARATEDEPSRREPVFAHNKSSEESLIDKITADISVYVDHQAVSDLWDKYRRGERKVFNRRIYSAEGQKAFDEIRARYMRSDEFRNMADRFIEEFERMLADVNRTSRDPNVTRNTLISSSGKTYTLLAHAAGRFE